MCIEIDKLNINSGDYDESIYKIKKECEAMIDKTYDKMSDISEVINIFIKINNELKKNIESINILIEMKFKLSDDSQLRQVEINTINAKIDDTLNFVCNKIYRKNRMRSKNINIFKLISLERMHMSSNAIISEMKDKINMIRRDLIYRDVYGMDIDEVHFINSEIKKS